MRQVFIKMLKLEPFSPADFHKLIEWIPDSSFALKWSGPAFTYPLTEEQLETYLKDSNTVNASKYIFKAVDESTNEVVGHISLGNVDRVHESARIGKVLIGHPEFRGKGYGGHLISAALYFAFDELKLHRVSLGVFDFNTPAIKCYEKAGFKKEGLLRDAAKYGDQYWNQIEMGILESEWRKRIQS
jgi:RimJ/RimL family protein N-acetyltransferase